MKYSIGDEWFDGYGGYIIVDTRRDEHGLNLVRVFDYEGCVAWESEDSWSEAIKEMAMTPIGDTVSIKERIEDWFINHSSKFLEEYKGTTAWWREESEPCQKGTTGCCINHNSPKLDSCETW